MFSTRWLQLKDLFVHSPRIYANICNQMQFCWVITCQLQTKAHMNIDVPDIIHNHTFLNAIRYLLIGCTVCMWWCMYKARYCNALVHLALCAFTNLSIWIWFYFILIKLFTPIFVFTNDRYTSVVCRYVYVNSLLLLLLVHFNMF